MQNSELLRKLLLNVLRYVT